MSEAGHDLHALFPDHGPALHALKLGNERFRKLASDHHDLEAHIRRAEAGLDPISDEALEDLKKKRLLLLDEVSGLIADKEAL